MSAAINIKELHNSHACSFIEYASNGEIVDFLYEDFKQQLYASLNIKTKNDLYFLLENEGLEDVFNYVTYFAEEKISKMQASQLDAFLNTYFI